MAWVLFFDGDCPFCCRSVRWVVKLDRRARVAVAPLQGKLAQEKGLTRYATRDGGSVVLLRESDGAVFFNSSALIELARALGGAWRLATAARFIPRPLRDWAYNWVAQNRYRILPKSTSCALPSSELLRRLRE
jgi:predicted DCC family thiol-disulfide oxidoreductase YuxK